MSDQLKFGYWGIRGLGQIVQLTLAACDMEYELIQHDATWFSEVKPELEKRFDFVNLPYILKGDMFLSESDAIVQYVIQASGKTELKGNNSEEQIRCLQIQGVLKDAFMQMAKLFWDPNATEVKSKILTENVLPKLAKIDALLKDRKYLVSNHLTYVDLYLLHFFQLFQAVDDHVVKNLTNIIAHQHLILEIPQIKHFYASDKCAPKFLPDSAQLKI